jgi:hypothetical protein
MIFVLLWFFLFLWFECPVCKSKVANPKESGGLVPYFPFCSRRCRLIDLGQWLDGQYRIPVGPAQPDENTPQPPKGQNGDEI